MFFSPNLKPWLRPAMKALVSIHAFREYFRKQNICQEKTNKNYQKYRVILKRLIEWNYSQSGYNYPLIMNIAANVTDANNIFADLLATASAIIGTFAVVASEAGRLLDPPHPGCYCCLEICGCFNNEVRLFNAVLPNWIFNAVLPNRIFNAVLPNRIFNAVLPNRIFNAVLPNRVAIFAAPCGAAR